MFNKVLIVNRGEIAVRVIKACKELGITTATIYSTADKTSLHARLGDESYFIGDSIPANSYLHIDSIITLAKSIGADAIHPGYGFLSERYKFIKAVEDAGITFIGPSSNSVALLGEKTSARKLMVKHGIPIVPGVVDAILTVEKAIEIADKIGYPVLIKAAAGGGGKGMKKVFSKEELPDLFNSARREALRAFGSGDVYIEKLILEPKHIEVQILGDTEGNYIHLFERECSLQRRHQKVIEEAPSPSISTETRNAITKTAIEVARIAGYYSAGTVEFLLDANQDFYFLEMNTRIQVEHPVSEQITGIDLVKEQIKIAAGNKIELSQNSIRIKGHSVEARVYSEDPNNNFLPTTGKIDVYIQPSGKGVRVDSGIEFDSEVTTYYDPMLSKVISFAVQREDAIEILKTALRGYVIGGVKTNIEFLITLLNNEKFIKGTYDISLIDTEYPEGLNSKNLNEIDVDDVVHLAAVLSLYGSSNEKAKQTRYKEQINHNRWLNKLYE